MKFAIRDDDLNYFYDPNIIEGNYKDIWDVCPISMSVIPFVKGDWPKWIDRFEKIGPGFIKKSIIDEFYKDNKIYALGDNQELVSFIKRKIYECRVYVTIHGIHHRNEDECIPQFNDNYGIGAEFFTNRNLTNGLQESILYLSSMLDQKIEIFTPPQNLISSLGIDSIINNNLNIIYRLPSIRHLQTYIMLGFNEYMKYLKFKLRKKVIDYPYPLRGKKISIANHFRLQPDTDINSLYASLNEVYKYNGSFVVSTHSYGFEYKMKDSNKKMGLVLRELVDYASTKPDVKFVNLKQIFE
jgi:hypothetical protein